MLLGKTAFKVLFLSGSLILCTSLGWAQTTAQQFAAQAQTDALSIASFLNTPFANSMGFISTLGWNTPPSVFDILAGPRVEVGIGVGADLINLPKLSGLNLPALSASDNVALPSFLPFPFPILTARVGLFNGLDVGFRATDLPQISLPVANLSANYFGWGLDVRYQFLKGAALPDVAVGASWDTMKGGISLSTAVNQSSTYMGYNADFTGTTGYALDWNVQSAGAQVQVGKDLGVIYPFAAVGFQRNSGSVVSTVSGTGNVTVNGGSSPVNLSAISGAAPPILEPKFVLGIDVGQGFHFGIVAESNGTEVAGSTSFRVQF